MASIRQINSAAGIDAELCCHVRRCKCPVCGEIFYADVAMWGWRIGKIGKYRTKEDDSHTSCVCFYSCMRKVEREELERRSKAMEQICANYANNVKRNNQAAAMKKKKLKEDFCLHIDWKHPDRDKVTGEPISLNQLITYVVQAKISTDRSKASTYVRKKIPAECWYQERIMKDLKRRAEKEGLPIELWKSAQGLYSKGGVSDVLAMIGGVFFAIEVKRPLFGDATKLQKEFIARINDAGGIAGVAVYPEDLDEYWERAAKLRRKQNDERVPVRDSQV